MLQAQALPWKDEIVAVGLARGIPNFKGEKHQHAEFKDVIERCRSLGWQITAHVGVPRLPCPALQLPDLLKVVAAFWLLQCICQPDMPSALIHRLLSSCMVLCRLHSSRPSVFARCSSSNRPA